MRWSTYRAPDGTSRAAAWSEGRLHPADAPLLDLLVEDRLAEAAA